MRTCLLIPHFDHVAQFRSLLPRLTATGLPLIVVDDASPDAAFASLQRLLDQEAAEVTVLRHQVNQGKGGAVISGLRAAGEAGFSHAVQVDADGQHDLGGLSALLAEASEHSQALICGEPVFDQTISNLRRRGRLVTHYLCRLETLSPVIKDALCGFRAYPLRLTVPLLNAPGLARRMGFDPEILVRACWRGIEIRFVPVRVTYPEHGRSHFRYFRDNLEISWMHTRLIFGMLIRLPVLVWSRFRARGPRHE